MKLQHGSHTVFQYAYANGSANTVRPTGMTYPDGRQLTYDYGTTGSAGDTASQVAAIKDGATALAEYTYLGLSSIVEVDYTQPQIKYDLIGTGSYPGLDQFSRIVDSLWTDYGSSTTPAQIEYGYDRVSNRTFRKNPVDPSSPRKFDALYSYDELYRLSHTDRGELNTGNTAISNLDFAQCWTLDETGNWSQFRQEATEAADRSGRMKAEGGSPKAAGTWNLVQNRTANQQNEITDVDNTVGSAWSTPKYFQAGNLFHAVLNSTSSASRESTTRLNQRPLRAARVLFKPVSPPGTPTWGTLTVDDWNDLTVDGWWP